MRLLVSEKPVTCVPEMPLLVVFWMNTRSKDGPVVFVSEMPTVAFWMAPPVQLAADVQVPPLPSTTRLPSVPVLLSRMPLAAPFEEMLRKVRLPAPMSVLVTFSAVPLAVAMVLTPVEVAAPPPVRLMPAALVPELLTLMSPMTSVPTFAAPLMAVPVVLLKARP
jgi:hypothetical protein